MCLRTHVKNTTKHCQIFKERNIYIHIYIHMGFPGGFTVKNLPEMEEVQEMDFDPWIWKILWRRKWQSTLLCLPGKSNGQRSLAGCSPCGQKRVGHDLVTKQQQYIMYIYTYIYIYTLCIICRYKYRVWKNLIMFLLWFLGINFLKCNINIKQQLNKLTTEFLSDIW